MKMGLFGLENLATEELAWRGVHEFLFTLTHAKTPWLDGGGHRAGSRVLRTMT